MDCRNISVFKKKEEVKEVITSTDAAITEDGADEDRKSDLKKKREYTTKQVVVPARYVLKYLEQRSKSKCLIYLSLLYPRGGIYRSIGSQEELQKLKYWDELNKSNLLYIRNFNGILHIDFSKGGKFTVDKKWLPDIPHMGILSQGDVRQLCNQLAI